MAMVTFGLSTEKVKVNPKTEQYTGILEIISNFFPDNMQKLFKELSNEVLLGAQEIRCRINSPVLVIGGTAEWMLQEQNQAKILGKEELAYIIQRINQSSVYAWEEEYRRGYLTLPGGHRVGLVGKALLSQGEIRTMKDISSLNFRIAKEIKGAADGVMPLIISEQRVFNTLLVAPPGCGKTTMLRDMVRQISNGVPALGFEGVNVGVVDERSELAGSVAGVAQLDLGLRTDVLDGCPKSQGMVMLVRSMAPRVLVTDEIGTGKDIEALEEVLNAGIALITTIHGQGWEDLKGRPHFKQLLAQQFFDRIIFLHKQKGFGQVDQVYQSGSDGYQIMFRG